MSDFNYKLDTLLRGAQAMHKLNNENENAYKIISPQPSIESLIRLFAPLLLQAAAQ